MVETRSYDLGINSEGGTPVPIPNTAVKPFSVDGSMALRHVRVDRCQDRGIFFMTIDS